MIHAVLKKEIFTPHRTYEGQDYFSIPDDKLHKLGFTVHKEMLELGAEKLTVQTLENCGFDKHQKETIVFNLPTGTGKSEVFYDLIQQYSEHGGYLILVCSPFVKLVEKDTAALRNRGVDVFSYQDLNPQNGDFESAWRAVIGRNNVPVHVMTINCLLRNSGSAFFEQRMEKGEYMNDLIGVAERDGKKVLLFIDELHESVENFSRKYLPHLVRWRQVLTKVFVASATHTPSSYAVIQHLGRLTSSRITVYESKRNEPSVTAAKLYIHFAHKRYDDKDLTGLSFLHEILVDAEGKRVHILCAYKAVAEALLRKSDKNPIKQFVGKFKKLVSGVNDPFDPLRNSIGTTFNTGVNMEDENTVFIIILPFSGSNDYRGVFTNGIPSVIQSLGRLRNGGTYHVIMGVPAQLISGTVLQNVHGDHFTVRKKDEEFKAQNQLLEDSLREYESRVASIKEEINFLRNCNGGKPQVESYYPSLQDFLLEETKDQVVLRSLSGGGSPDAYLLWAACNDQLSGAKLQHAILYYLQKQELELTDAYDKNAGKIFSLFPSLQKEVAERSLHDAFVAVFQKTIKKPAPYKLTFKVRIKLL